jgi:hypothetical protein
VNAGRERPGSQAFGVISERQPRLGLKKRSVCDRGKYVSALQQSGSDRQCRTTLLSQDLLLSVDTSQRLNDRESSQNRNKRYRNEAERCAQTFGYGEPDYESRQNRQ